MPGSGIDKKMIDEKIKIPKTPKNPKNMALPKGVKSPVDYTKLYMSNEMDGDTISEKALSKKQQQFFGIVRAIQKGEQAPTTPETAKAAADMKKSDVKKFASTKHKNLPDKIEEKLDNDDKPFVKKLVKNLRKGSNTHAKQADKLEKAMNEQLGGTGAKVAPSPQEMKKNLTTVKKEAPANNLEYGNIAQRQKIQGKLENMGNQRATTTTTSGTGAGGLKNMSISDAGTVKSFNAKVINKMGNMGGAKLEMDSGGLVPNVGKFVQDVGKNALSKNTLVPDAMKGQLNKGLANTAQQINQQTPGTDAFKQKTIAMQINKNVRKNQNLNASYNMNEDIADEALTIQDWNSDNVNYTEIETVDVIKPKPLRPAPSNWREELDEDWQKVNRKDKTDGLSKKAVKAYRRENPGSKLQTAVTTKPSKLKKGSKSAKRRLSFCRRMKGMKKKLTSAKTRRDPDSRINKALRRWNC